MAQMPGSTGSQKPRTEATPNDIYTVLAGIALVTVLGTLAFAMYRCVQLFDTLFPGFPG
ncbi:MAG: hypothetical protein JXQ75_04370 [Phycisphaerae bacterium]|nr:hypothetical protein [Phycisphaerae bacterium]